MKRQDLVDALELFDSVSWADDDPTPDFWRDAYQVLADAARERLAQLRDDALVIEKVDGEWPDWFLEGLGRVAFARAVETIRRETGPGA